MQKIYHKIKKHPSALRILNNKHFQKYEKIVLVVIWAGFIYYLSSKPLAFLSGVSTLEFTLRKIAHMFVFGVLCYFIYRYLSRIEKRHMLWNIGWATIFSILYAISDEYHQTLVPGRVGTYQDVLIDSAGILIVTWLLYLHYHHLIKLKKKAQEKAA